MRSMKPWNLALDALAVAARVGERVAKPDTLPPADHRPWPLPDEPWIMAQTWNDLLFAHWPLPPEAVAPRLPATLALDTFDGQAWIAVTPFTLTALRLRGIPFVPGVADFFEINVRTYVRRDGKPGVFFFSLDAGSALAVAAARRLYALPYHHADFAVTREGERIRYACRRRGATPAIFEAEYEPAGEPAPGGADAREAWLTERYCLYAVDATHAVYRAEIHHAPWPLQRARAEIRTNTMAAASGFSLPDRAPLVHFARRLDVLVWRPELVPTADAARPRS
jgi:uncharacterized protein YqjF (DUF2071 family)